MSRSTMRESIYPLISYDFLTSLDECVETTRECSKALEEGMAMLARGTDDLPRLRRVLRNRHVSVRAQGPWTRPDTRHPTIQHYVVLPQPTISHHLSALSTSLAPQIQILIQKAETLVENQSGQVKNLEQRLEMIESAMLPPASSRSTSNGRDDDSGLQTTQGDVGEEVERAGEGEGKEEGRSVSRGLDGLSMTDMNPIQRRKVLMLRSKRKKLEEERARLDRAA